MRGVLYYNAAGISLVCSLFSDGVIMDPSHRMTTTSLKMYCSVQLIINNTLQIKIYK